MRESLALRRKLLSPGNPDLAVGLNNLAYLIWRQGNFDEAESMYREALAIDRQTYGNVHPEVATKVLNLAVLLRDRGNPQAAEPLARESLEIRRKILGEHHSAVGSALDSLGGILEDMGRLAEAETMVRQGLEVARRAHGDMHMDSGRMQHNLGWILWKQGAYAEAETLLRRAADIIPKTYGPTYRGARQAQTSLAHALNGLGDFRAAETTARAALEAYRKFPNDGAVANALIALGHALIAQRRHEEAVPQLREALESVDKSPQFRSPWFKGEIQSSLGAALAADKVHITEAEKLLLNGYEGLRDLPSTPPHRVRAAMERLVSFYTASGQAAEAATWNRRLHGFDAAAKAAK
jgi:tetratricopeptide (TPR) repeat protein